MTRSDRQTVEEAANLFQHSCEGRCSNPRCPSKHIDTAPDCVEFARANLLVALSTPPEPSLDRLRAIEYEAESWHDAIRRGDFGPSTCACNRADGTRCSLGAALEGAPDD